MTNAEWATRGNKVFIGTYSRFPAAMVKGSGCRLWDADGKEYLDFLAGIAVCSLGHCHPAVTEAICRQAGELVHVSNLFHTPPQIRLAELLVNNSFADRVFMCNSGAEANEAAIKLARIHSGEGRYEIISLAGSFHGRTLATVAATGQPRFHQGFEPLPQGFVHAEFGDPRTIEALVSSKTCAILCEPLQGESGVRPLEPEYIRAIRDICDRHGLLLIFDEVQTGLGRTGTLFAHEQLGVTPDIMTLAKALGNGLPLGAMLTTESIAASLTVGTHASTFGGNPVATAAAVEVLTLMLADGFMASIREKSAYFVDKLQGVAVRYPQWATGVRGRGLLLGLMLTDKGIERGAEIVQRMFEEGALINFAGNRVLRFVPPLIVGTAEIDTLVDKLCLVLDRLA
ncbi:MAG: aspartate aminotransferase family protein [Desulfobulbus sp.]|jgi:acetylornithine aminotransferase/acetylornithine/N-succinyldiaminopimelate aminotransferase|uniref:aspartate aminotransferase family protein n=1 Tax=Desulfobulbus sp. TaxID=895 RepID=UPI00284A454A|nr:aspartate aminotransferase family protein [Desulfobulbus sp.]MDR2548629.1 aspartate aminotransferase family protein [Desulfobulbus sp.]